VFLYLAEKAKHAWLKLDKIDLGRGKRSLVKSRTYLGPAEKLRFYKL